jgi:hypothetical protein
MWTKTGPQYFYDKLGKPTLELDTMSSDTMSRFMRWPTQSKSRTDGKGNAIHFTLQQVYNKNVLRNS